MVSLTRRQLLRGTTGAVTMAGLGGCTTPTIPGVNDGASIPDPFTNEPYTESYVQNGHWLMEGHDGGRTANADSAIPKGDVDIAWLRRPGSDPHSATAPVVGPDRIYIGYVQEQDDTEKSESYLASFDAETGDQHREVHLGTGRIVGLALVGDTLLTVIRGPEYEQATITALSRANEAIRWTETLPDVTGPPAVVDGTSYLATRDDDNAVYAYGRDGTQRWRTPIDGECYTAICADADGVYVGLTDGRIAALAPTGEQRWTTQVASPDECCPDIQGMPTIVDGRLYVPGIKEELVAVDTTDGSVDWRTTVLEKDYGNPVPSPAVTEDTAYVNTHHGGLVAVALSDGSVQWRSSDNGDLQSPAAGNGGVVVPRTDSVLAYDGADSQAWSIDITVPDIGMAGYVMDTEVVLAHGMCYVGIADGRIYAIGASGD